jgi:tryptophan 2,3-dioxygenase
LHTLTSRISGTGTSPFPYEEIVGEFQRVGKHFVSDWLLDALEDARDGLPIAPEAAEQLKRFLDILLDKRDGVYDYHSYLALNLLPGLPEDRRGIARDRLVAQLVADALRFEDASARGETDLLLRQRPAPAVIDKRLRLGLRVVGAPLPRLGLGTVDRAASPRDEARRVCELVAADLTAAERHVLRITMLPVDTIHDEYLFIRILQAFETTFMALAAELSDTVKALSVHDTRDAIRRLDASAATMREVVPLFSLAATMQTKSFQTFREHTDGASAIQSRNYKLIEALCRAPDESRIASEAYETVPEVREMVRAGMPTINDCATRLRGQIAPDEYAELTNAMDRFAAGVSAWRRTHYRIAVHMLGERPGTGSTVGTPYLAMARSIPVFRTENQRSST